MDSRFNNSFGNEQEDIENNSPENSEDSPRSAMFNDTKTTSTSSQKRSSRRAIQKRVVSVPIKDVDGSRLKGETSAPPHDSWAWRKYGQKPIKGSPYPRGYYRCSSSKGCPARKQVERSREDPTMVVVTYTSEHNHSWPAAKNNHNHHHNITSPTIEIATTAIDDTVSNSQARPESSTSPSKLVSNENFDNLGEELLIANDEFGWFCDLQSTSSIMLDSPILSEDKNFHTDVTMIFSMREEDESLFADLGELPECSQVFQRGVMEREEEDEGRRCSLTPWCGTTG